MNRLDVFTALTGITAAFIVATGQPQPIYGIAFWFYVISACVAVYSNYNNKNWPYVLLFGVYVIIDSYGVIHHWPF